MNDEHHDNPEDHWMDEHIRQRERLNKFFKILLWTGLILLLPAIFVARPVYREFKVWRANALAQEAAELLKETPPNVYLAYQKAMSAYALTKNEIEVLRVVARVYERIHPINAFNFWKVVVEHPEHQLDDRIQFTKTAFSLNKREVILEQIRWFEENHINTPQVKIIKIQWYQSESRIEHALRLAEELFNDTTVDTEMRLVYPKLCLISSNANLQNKGIMAIEQLITGFDEQTLAACRLVILFNNIPKPLLEKACLKLRNHPHSQLIDRLNSYAVFYRLGNIRRDTLFSQTEALFDNKNPQQFLEYVKWLSMNGFSKQFLTKVTLEQALNHKDIFSLYIKALAVDNNKSLLKELLNKPKIPIEEFYRNLLLMHYHKNENDPKEAKRYLNKAILCVESQKNNIPSKLWQIETYTRQMGWQEDHQMIVLNLMKIPSEQRRAFETLVTSLKKQGKTQEMLKHYKALIAQTPQDPIIINDYAYLRLLLGIEIKDSINDVKKLIKDHPKFLAYHITLTLGYLRNNQINSAMQTLQGISTDWLIVSNHFKATVLAVLLRLKNKDNDETIRQLLNSLEPESLLPEEKALIGLKQVPLQK